MVLGEGENFFSREKPNVGFDILPFPKPQPLSRKAECFFCRYDALPEIICPFSRKAECFLAWAQPPAVSLPYLKLDHYDFPAVFLFDFSCRKVYIIDI